MHSFSYKNESLHCEQVDVANIVENVGTPTYIYSKATMLNHLHRLQSSLSELDMMTCYAVKACSNIAILNLFAKEGAGFDIVSGGELFRVIKAGGNPSLCTFAGVGKTEKEIRFALESGVYSFNVESEAELLQIDRIAGEMGLKAPVALRLNPNVEAFTHKFITTGTNENKFGIDFEFYEAACERALQLPNIHLKGIQMHIGSQLSQVDPFVKAIKKVTPLVLKLKEQHGISYFSIGGGLGIVYGAAMESGSNSWWINQNETDRPLTIEKYAQELLPLLKALNMKIIIEPGRVLVGNAGILVTRCLYKKIGTAKTFAIVDAGFNDLIRPALYEGFHEIIPINKPQSSETTTIDLVGPVCESGDFFAKDRKIAPLQEGDLVALLSAGAYGFTMSSQYNSRPLVAEILVDGDHYDIIRERQTWEDLIAGEKIPQ